MAPVKENPEDDGSTKTAEKLVKKLTARDTLAAELTKIVTNQAIEYL
jgi:hypothetical protein